MGSGILEVGGSDPPWAMRTLLASQRRRRLARSVAMAAALMLMPAAFYSLGQRASSAYYGGGEGNRWDKVEGDSQEDGVSRKLLDAADYVRRSDNDDDDGVDGKSRNDGNSNNSSFFRSYDGDDRFLYIGDVRFDRSRMVYAQIPKTGSTTLGNMMGQLADGNNVHWNVGPRFRNIVGDKMSQRLFVEEAFHPWFDDGLLSRRPDDPARQYRGLGFTGHVRFLDFREFGGGRDNPVWVTQVRDPVDSFVSWFNYIRRQPGRFDERVSSLGGVEAAERWRDMNVSECVLRRVPPDCQLEKGRSQREPSLITFLCGNSRRCSLFGDRGAMARAKANAERFFAVVGVLEHLQETLQLLQDAAPNFLQGITDMNVLHRNAAPSAHSVTPEARAALAEALELELELYEFLRQRLLEQHKRVFPRGKGRESP